MTPLPWPCPGDDLFYPHLGIFRVNALVIMSLRWGFLGDDDPRWGEFGENGDRVCRGWDAQGGAKECRAGGADVHGNKIGAALGPTRGESGHLG
jgi:cytochrome b